MYKIYSKTARFFDTGLLGVLIGIFSGIAINIATSQNSIASFDHSILSLSAGVFFLIVLTEIRQGIDNALVKRDSDETGFDVKWEAALDKDNKMRLCGYIISFILFAGFSVMGICFIVKGNKEMNKMQTETSSMLELKSIEHDKLLLDKLDSLQEVNRKILIDSINKQCPVNCKCK